MKLKSFTFKALPAKYTDFLIRKNQNNETNNKMNKKSRQHIESALQHTCPKKQLSHVQRALELMSFGGPLQGGIQKGHSLPSRTTTFDPMDEEPSAPALDPNLSADDDFLKAVASKMLMGFVPETDDYNKNLEKFTQGHPLAHELYQSYKEDSQTGKELRSFVTWSEALGGNKRQAKHYALLRCEPMVQNRWEIPDNDAFIIEIDITRNLFRIHKKDYGKEWSIYHSSNNWTIFMNDIMHITSSTVIPKEKYKYLFDIKNRLEFTIGHVQGSFDLPPTKSGAPALPYPQRSQGPLRIETMHLHVIYKRHFKDLEIEGFHPEGANNLIWFFGNKVLRISTRGLKEKEKQTGKPDELTDKEVNDAIENWKLASDMELVPNVEWIGFVLLNDLDTNKVKPFIINSLLRRTSSEERAIPTTRYMAIIMDRYRMNFVTFIDNQKKTYLDWKSIEDVIEQIVQKTWEITVDLGMACMDTKPENIVINTQPELEVRLIDLDECKETTKKWVMTERMYSKGAFVLSICLLALHSLQLWEVNLFLPFLRIILPENQFPEIYFPEIQKKQFPEIHFPEIQTKKGREDIWRALKKSQKRRKGHAFGTEMFTGTTMTSIEIAWKIHDVSKIAKNYFCIDSLDDVLFMSTRQSPNPRLGVPEYYKNSENYGFERTQKLMNTILTCTLKK